MKDTTEPGAAGDAQALWRRLAWLAAIWLASVSSLAVIAGLLRAWLAP